MGGTARCRGSVFPLGKTGGLIEAVENINPVPDDLVRCFRWVKPAASLKREQGSELVPWYRAFPLGKTGGLIEAHHQAFRPPVSFIVSAG